MGIISGAFAGAGEQLAKIGAARMTSDLDTERQLTVGRANSELETKRQQTMELFKDKLKNAPMDRLTTKAKEFAGQEVPVEAGPVTRLTGYDAKASEAGPAEPGFQGDVGIIRKQVAGWKDGPEKDAALAQIERQVANDTNFEKGIIAGKTRKRTSDEALDAAAEDAKINDVGAYAAYEEKIGKTKREERKLDNAERKADAGARSAIDREDRRDQRQIEAEDRKDARLQARLDAAEKRKEQGGPVTREERLRFTSLFEEAGRRLNETQKSLATLRKDPSYKIAEKGSPQADEIDELRGRIKSYETERSLWGGLLAGGSAGPKPDASASPTSPKAAPAAPASSSSKSDSDALLSDLRAELSTQVPGSTTYAETQRNIQTLEAASGKTPAGRAVGQTQVVQSGPHKGKTATWDGKGWVLK